MAYAPLPYLGMDLSIFQGLTLTALQPPSFIRKRSAPDDKVNDLFVLAVPFKKVSFEDSNQVSSKEVLCNYIQRLPCDVLFIIMAMVQNLRDRLNMLQVCKFWHQTLRSAVYANLRIRPAEIRRFLYSVSKDPRLAAMVRDFSVRTIIDDRKYTCQPDFRLFLKERGAEIYPGDTRVLWHRATPGLYDVSFHYETEEKYMAELLPFFVNLRKLHVRYTDFAYNWAAMMASRIAIGLEKLNGIPLALQKVRECFIVGGTRPCAAKYVHPFIHLPELRVLRLSRVYDFDNETIPSEGPYANTVRPRPGTSSITELRFIELCCSNQGCRDFILACKKLEVFEYQHTHHISIESLGFNFSAYDFYEPLATHKETLRYLRLCDKSETDIGRYMYDSDQCKWFGSLVDFDALEHLWMPLRGLLNFQENVVTRQKLIEQFADILPTSLKTLHVADTFFKDIELVTKNVWSMLDVRKEQFPNLTTITVQFSGYEWPWGVPRTPARVVRRFFQTLALDAEELGVELKCEGKKD